MRLESIRYMASMEFTVQDLGSLHKEVVHPLHHVRSVIPRPASERHLGTCQKSQFSDPIADPLHQQLSGQGPALGTRTHSP